jgi:hypothetical protein
VRSRTGAESTAPPNSMMLWFLRSTSPASNTDNGSFDIEHMRPIEWMNAPAVTSAS